MLDTMAALDFKNATGCMNTLACGIAELVVTTPVLAAPLAKFLTVQPIQAPPGGQLIVSSYTSVLPTSVYWLPRSRVVLGFVAVP